jgi:uncharacterized membrane protein
MDLIVGFTISAMVSSVFPRGLVVLVDFLSIIIGLVELERAKYWGLLYSLGYLLGLILIGRYLMESWELIIYCLIVGLYVVQKIVRKAKI